MRKYILYFLAFYALLVVVCAALQYFEILPQTINSGLNIAASITCTYLAANKFVKDRKRVPAAKEKLVFASCATIFSEIIGIVLWIFLFDYVGFWMLLLLAVMLIIKSLVIFYFFGFYSKIIIQGINKQ